MSHLHPDPVLDHVVVEVWVVRQCHPLCAAAPGGIVLGRYRHYLAVVRELDLRSSTLVIPTVIPCHLLIAKLTVPVKSSVLCPHLRCFDIRQVNRCTT